ncbi:MAG: endonuclease/exonuclease/phosphatase family protein [Planctomycetia bacterium]|nr:endonuclease/exonuclease/phosphatase family protein [Planctomycetia bacterium]
MNHLSLQRILNSNLLKSLTFKFESLAKSDELLNMAKSVALSVFCLPILGIFLFCNNSSYSFAKSEDFRVMSFNIRLASANDGDNSWNFRKETLLAEIQENDPLLLGVQEAQWIQMTFLSKNLTNYDFIGVGRDDGQKGGEFSAIFYKKDALTVLDSGTFWLSEKPEKAGVKGWDAACNRVVSWGKFQCRETDKVFLFANTHFDHIGQTARVESAKLIQRWRNENFADIPFIISGDFNITDKNEAYQILISDFENAKALKDSRKIAESTDWEEERTFHNFGKIPAKKADIIDFIFVSDFIVVKKFKISPVKRDGRYPSDHCSIIATIAL